MRTGCSMVRQAPGWICLTASLVLLAGCENSHLLTGSFVSTERVTFENVPGLGTGAYVKLVLGQFGPDVAGIIRFCSDPDCALSVKGICDCRFLIDGRYENGDLVFGFLAPYPCDGGDPEELAGWLTSRNNGNSLEGPIGRTYDGRKWTFSRKQAAGDLTTEDKTCDQSFTGAVPDSGPGDDGADLDGGNG